jgi:hypothetical protein
LRPEVVAGIAAVALAVAVDAKPATLSAPTRAQLERMPLPRAAYGSILATAKRLPSAAWVPNGDAGQGALDPRLSAPQLTRLGRVTGYAVRFEGSGLGAHDDGLVNALTEVDLYRTDAGAARFVALQADVYRRMEGRRVRIHKIVFDRVSHFAVPGLSEARGIRARFDIGGGSRLSLTTCQLRVGTIAAVVGFLRSDERDMRAQVVRLARALDRRIRGVRAGRIR